jgi:hypothetical protein
LRREGSRLKGEHCAGDPETSSFSLGLWAEGGQSWKTGLCVINFQTLSHMSGRGVLGLGWSDSDGYFFEVPEAAGGQDPAVCHRTFCEHQQ